MKKNPISTLSGARFIDSSIQDMSNDGYNHGFSGVPPSLSDSDEERIFRLNFPIRRNRLINRDFILEDMKFTPHHYKVYEKYYQGILYKNENSLEGLQNLFNALQDFYMEDNNILHIHVQRLVLKLILYSQVEPPNGFALDHRDYIKYNLRDGPSFTTWLKKCRQAMMIKSLSESLIEDNKSFIGSIQRNIYNISLENERYDYDSFLHEQHLLRYIEDADDFAWAFEEVQAEEKWYSVFRSSANNLLKKHKLFKINQCGNEEYSTWISDSVTQTDEGPILNRRLMRQMAIDGTSLSEIEESRNQQYFRFKRKSVFVSPGNARDTWQCYPRTLFKVKRISHLLRQILDPLPGSAMASPKKAYHRRQRLRNNDFLYFMFDYKKCGLTVNRKLLTILGEELNLIYPDQGFDELCHFNDVIVENGSSSLHPLRGVGLGNCNEGITLIQCVIGNILKSSQNLDGVFFNDDGIYAGPFDEIQRSFGWILTAIQKLGMIINLKKTIISDCNIFCEDYFITKMNMSYEKVQSLIIPFAETFFVNNVSRAKILCNDLCRNLVGRKVKIDLFFSLVHWWGYEFHPSEEWWPFELGGWQRYGYTSINTCLNTIYYPKDYCPARLEGSIPLFREWAKYLVCSQNIREMCRFTGNIRYRKSVKNPFIDPSLSYPHSEKIREWIDQLGISDNDSQIKTLHDLYNIRGLKNAKPHIKIGKANKLFRMRRGIWNTFKQYRSNHDRSVFERHPSEILNILKFLRGNELTPQMYEPPYWSVLIWKELSPKQYTNSGHVLFPDNYIEGRNDRLSIFKAMESVNNGYLLEGARPDKLRRYNQKLENRPIVSDERFKVPFGSIPSIRKWIKLFFGKRKFAMIYYATVYNRFPVSLVELPQDDDLEKILKDSISSIFPQCKKRYWRLVKLARKLAEFETLLDSFHCREYRDENIFNNALTELENYVNSSLDIPIDQTVDPWDDFYSDLFEASVDWDLVNFQFGQIDFDELLYEYELEHDFEAEYISDPEDIDYDFVESPSRSTLASFKEPMSLDL
jgi:hypothetical protein